MPGPLEGVRIVELGVWVAGPAAGGILSDWGTDVIKIEPLTGDPARTFQHMLGGDMPTNPVFELDNRSKRSIAVDLSDDEGLAIAKELIADADVFVTNVRLAGLERLGLDHETLLAEHPRLVCAAITNAGMAAAAVSAALFSRERTGQGQLCSTSLFRTGIYTISFDLSITVGWGLTLGVGNRETMHNPTTNNYVTGDGKRFWVVGLEAQRYWPPLARAARHPEWITDERFATSMDRARNGLELIAGLLLGTGSITRRSACRPTILCRWRARRGSRRHRYNLNDRHTSRFRRYTVGATPLGPRTRRAHGHHPNHRTPRSPLAPGLGEHILFWGLPRAVGSLGPRTRGAHEESGGTFLESDPWPQDSESTQWKFSPALAAEKKQNHSPLGA